MVGELIQSTSTRDPSGCSWGHKPEVPGKTTNKEKLGLRADYRAEVIGNVSYYTAWAGKRPIKSMEYIPKLDGHKATHCCH
ncbi:MAG: hypothetical protein NPIRA03_34390 [Nitrospirales bacterium]|nr:MAG: hypothetical protein NPIRA03_34390 [Nitrospirales bacterium]